ncbi:MAG: tetratricopeptide repeat protein [Luteolibacter sp.]
MPSTAAATAASVLILVSCGPTEIPPYAVVEAQQFSRDGRDAFREGKVDEAYQAYAKALELQRSIDDSAGIVRTLVNLAAISNAAGRSSDASVFLDAIDRYIGTVEASTGIDPRDKPLNEALAEASWMRAYLHADAGRISAAWAEIQRGKSRAGGSSREIAGRFANLEARLFLDSGDPASALTTSRRALRLNRRNDDDTETADSWRYIGRSLSQTGDPSGAYDAFAKALELDTKLARTSKVTDDLLGMAAAARDAGRPDQALACAERARTAARAAGDSNAEARANKLKSSL